MNAWLKRGNRGRTSNQRTREHIGSGDDGSYASNVSVFSFAGSVVIVRHIHRRCFLRFEKHRCGARRQTGGGYRGGIRRRERRDCVFKGVGDVTARAVSRNGSVHWTE